MGAPATIASVIPFTADAPGSMGRRGFTSDTKESITVPRRKRSMANSQTRWPSAAESPVVSTSAATYGISMMRPPSVGFLNILPLR